MMRHLINKHYDTHGGFSVILTNVSSHIKAPVSLKDETMKQTRRNRLDIKGREVYTKSFLGYEIKNTVTYFMMKRLDIFHAQIHHRTLGTKTSHEWFIFEQVLKTEGLAMPKELTPSRGYSIEVQGGE